MSETPYPFHTTVRVRFNETDQQGHVNFGVYLQYFDVALTAYLRELGHGYSELLAAGWDMLFVNTHATFHTPAYFEEVLRLHCRIGRVGHTSMRFDFQIFGEGEDGGRLVTTGQITVVTVDRQSRHKVSVPVSLRRAIQPSHPQPQPAQGGIE